MDARVLVASIGTAYAAAVLVWTVSLARRDASIVDVAWGPMFLAVTLAATTAAGAWGEPRALLLVALVTVWSLRLAGHLLPRNLRFGEDARYRSMRERAGEGWWWKSLFKVFLLQASILIVVALVLVQPIAEGGAVGPIALVGAAIAIAGILFEAAADAQLARFKRDPANEGKVLDSGLWAWSRHPNYFGESVVWWGLYVVALGVGGAWWTVVSPLLMTFLLLKVSGVAMLEKHMQGRAGYVSYTRRTSAFVPMPPRREG